VIGAIPLQRSEPKFCKNGPVARMDKRGTSEPILMKFDIENFHQILSTQFKVK
jgi:hypothetical protein